ncbi:TolC family protein [Pedobacter sp. NJ-S-72]
MKKIFVFSFLLFAFIGFQSSAQDTTIIGEVNYGLLEKYIQAAKEYFPRKKIYEAKVEGAKTAIPMNAVSYLDIFNASYFYRPGENTVLNAANPYSVNGFQFGVNINLGNFLQKPYLGKKARAEYKVAKLESQEYDTTLAIEVKKRYYNYVQQISQLKINTQSVQDNKNVADNLKYKFEKGELSLDVYNQSRINLASAKYSKNSI